MTIRKQATIRDVAKMAGVAVSTASRALGNGPASKATREKVEHAAKQLQFVPNPTARRLSEGTSDIVALVVQETPSFIFGDPNIAEMVGSLSVNLTREGLIPFLSLANPKDADGFGRLLRETGADAAVAISSHMGDALLRVVGESDVPWVFIGKPPKGLRCPYVDVDQKRAGYDVGRLLVERGRRHMAVISGPFDMSAPQGRNQGFEQALAEDGLKPEVVMEADFSAEGGFGGMIRVIRNHPEVDAVFAHSDQMAAGALRYLLQAGRKVPQDVSLVGFDDLRIARALSPSLTTCAQPIEQLSSAVVDLLKRSLGSEKRVRDSAIFRAPLVLRESV